ncbi:MAG TPA: Calx-beta domain-containing protein, partial [Candidatus Sulfotelmatobacter sp.]|nr:Calx-beta domain-containing protein [Candidatus Sulfotelmatobacter sp.]
LARLNSNGSLDLSFVPPPSRSAPWILALLCQPDGKLLVGGQLPLPDGRSAAVMRLNPDGSRDSTFSAPPPGGLRGRPLLLQPDGKIIVDGKWRLNPDGSRDYSFFTGDETAGVSGAVLLPDGDLLVSGDFGTFAGWPRPCLVRLHGGTAAAFGFFEFAEPWLSLSEAAGTVQVRVRRVGATNETARVKLTTVDGTARAGVDYSPFSSTLSFAPGTVEQTVAIPILRRAGYQGDRSFELQLQDCTAGIRAPTGPDSVVFIRETEPGLTFSQTNYWIVSEAISTNGTGAWVATVQRHGDLTGALSVQCQLVAGTAVAGQDFITTNLTLLFQPQQSELMVVAPVLRNAAVATDRTLFLVLNHPVPDLSLATDATAMLTIWSLPRLPSFTPTGSLLDTNGCMRLECDTEPNQFLVIETSTDLVNWIYLGYVYRQPNTAPVVIEDPEAWKYPRRFYRIPLYQLRN